MESVCEDCNAKFYLRGQSEDGIVNASCPECGGPNVAEYRRVPTEVKSEMTERNTVRDTYNDMGGNPLDTNNWLGNRDPNLPKGVRDESFASVHARLANDDFVPWQEFGFQGDEFKQFMGDYMRTRQLIPHGQLMKFMPDEFMAGKRPKRDMAEEFEEWKKDPERYVSEYHERYRQALDEAAAKRKEWEAQKKEEGQAEREQGGPLPSSDLTHKLVRRPGERGRGVLLKKPDGQTVLHTWPVNITPDDPFGGAMHGDYVQQYPEAEHIGSFEIDPNGELVTPVGMSGNLDDVAQTATNLDPNLKLPGQGEVLEDDEFKLGTIMERMDPYLPYYYAEAAPVVDFETEAVIPPGPNSVEVTPGSPGIHVAVLGPLTQKGGFLIDGETPEQLMERGVGVTSPPITDPVILSHNDKNTLEWGRNVIESGGNPLSIATYHKTNLSTPNGLDDRLHGALGLLKMNVWNPEDERYYPYNTFHQKLRPAYQQATEIPIAYQTDEVFPLLQEYVNGDAGPIKQWLESQKMARVKTAIFPMLLPLGIAAAGNVARMVAMDQGIDVAEDVAGVNVPILGGGDPNADEQPVQQGGASVPPTAQPQFGPSWASTRTADDKEDFEHPSSVPEIGVREDDPEKVDPHEFNADSTILPNLYDPTTNDIGGSLSFAADIIPDEFAPKILYYVKSGDDIDEEDQKQIDEISKKITEQIPDFFDEGFGGDEMKKFEESLNKFLETFDFDPKKEEKEPKKSSFNPGDQVRMKIQGPWPPAVGTILEIDKGWATIQLDSGAKISKPLSELIEDDSAEIRNINTPDKNMDNAVIQDFQKKLEELPGTDHPTFGVHGALIANSPFAEPAVGVPEHVPNPGQIVDGPEKRCPKCGQIIRDHEIQCPNPNCDNAIQVTGGAVEHQGPHTEEQVAAVADYLIESERESEVQVMIENPWAYDKELAIVQGRDPSLMKDVGGEDPQPPMPAQEEAPPEDTMPVPGMSVPQGGGMPGGGTHGMMAAIRKANPDFKFAEDHKHEELHRPNVPQTPAAEQEKPRNVERETDTSRFWVDENGEPLQTGQEYEMHSRNYDIPDIIRVEEIKPNAIEYTITGQFALEHRTEITRKEAEMEELTFTSIGFDESGEGLDDIELEDDSMDDYERTAPGMDKSDLSTPSIHMTSKVADYDDESPEVQTGSCGRCGENLNGLPLHESCPECGYTGGSEEDPAWKGASSGNPLVDAVKAYALEHYEEGGWDSIVEAYEDSEIAELIAGTQTEEEAIKRAGEAVGIWDERRTEIQSLADEPYFGNRQAGFAYNSLEQRDFIDEQGKARNLDKLDLKGTHYIDEPDEDFLFGI